MCKHFTQCSWHPTCKHCTEQLESSVQTLHTVQLASNVQISYRTAGIQCAITTQHSWHLVYNKYFLLCSWHQCANTSHSAVGIQCANTALNSWHSVCKHCIKQLASSRQTLHAVQLASSVQTPHSTAGIQCTTNILYHVAGTNAQTLHTVQLASSVQTLHRTPGIQLLWCNWQSMC